MKKTFFFLAALMASAVMMAQTPTVSASKVTMKYCKTTYGTRQVYTNTYPVTVDGFTFTEDGTYVRKLENTRGCDSVITYTVGRNTEGLLPGKFSVASGKQVQFAKGNLMYRASNGTAYPNEGCLKHKTLDGEAQGEWKLADNQLTNAGNVESNSSPSSTRTGWMDLFGWGNSGYNQNYQPYNHEGYNGTNIELSGSTYGKYDWGYYNAIQGGGNYPGLWRTMTQSEWDYLLNDRTNASSKWGFGSVDGTKGMFLLPDVWEAPYSGFSFYSGSNTNNEYTSSQWQQMEANGAVFLIADYYRNSNGSLSGSGAESTYWTVSGSSYQPYFLNTYSNKYELKQYTKDCGSHIRLVSDAPAE